MSLPVYSIAVPFGHEEPSPCRLCTPPNRRREVAPRNCKVAAMHAVSLSVEVYQKMLYRGWARSGLYCYKPDLKKSCCPQYAYRLDALAFQPSKRHRKLLRRWNRRILYGRGDVTVANIPPGRSRQSEDSNDGPDLVESVHAPESTLLENLTPAHRYEVTLEAPSFSDEKLSLYNKYFTHIHEEGDSTPYGFERHLGDTPFRETEPIPYPSTPPESLPRNYGTYHQLYRVDGRLVAMSVLDVLPSGVVSVYFMYDVDWKDYGLGKVSALREVALVKEMHEAGLEDMKYLFLGYYEHSSQKMRYKAEYSPAYLADPETYLWYPLEECIPLLDKYRYACFTDPTQSIEGDAPKAEEVSPPLLTDDPFDGLYSVISSENPGSLVPLQDASLFDTEYHRQDVRAVINSMGVDIAKSILWLHPYTLAFGGE